jgi:molybdopterin converting factor small subunit
MIVTIILSSPYSDIIEEKEINIKFEEIKHVSFKELLEKVREEYPEVKTLLPSCSNEVKVYGNLLPVKNGKVVFLTDKIFDGDIIRFFGSLSGG